MEDIKITLDDVDNMRLDVPITKVDRENRTVSGFATLDNIDKHGDVISAEASSKAFARFRGNIREMHMPVAVGKMVSFEEKVHHDEEDGKDYKGIYVTAKISKGAEDTWTKVLDGTLSGFSIGAIAKEKEMVVRDDGSSYRIIKDYDLFELSLVDSPANPLANVISIMKSDDGFEVSGIAVEAGYEASEGNSMSKLENVLNRVADALEKFMGGKDMSDKTDKTVEEAVETPDETVEKSDEATDEVVEKAEETVDTDTLVNSIVEKVLERLSVENAETDEVVTEEATEEVEEVEKSDDSDDDDVLAKTLGDINETLKSLSDAVTNVKAEVTNVSDRVETLEDSGAIRKSADVDESEEVKKESFWGGNFSGSRYISADTLDG